MKTVRRKWPARAIVAGAGIVVTVVAWQSLLSPRARNLRYRTEMLQALRSPDPESRKQAAWAIIGRPELSLEAFLVRGVLGDEPDPDVREAYTYALGKLGDPRNFAAIESAIDADPSGYVRAAAWLAAARCDPQHFRTLVETRAQRERPWEQIGIAQGRLDLDDVQDVNVLLHWARSGNPSQRQVAARALYKSLRPLLDAVGRWPAGAQIRAGQLWPPEIIDEVERRCAALDLQAIADETRRHRRRAERVRRNVTRLTRARDGLVGLLFAQ
ncbi:MAG: HEAT repeat domain-containing protein [Phycisphaerae bacterium]